MQSAGLIVKELRESASYSGDNIGKYAPPTGVLPRSYLDPFTDDLHEGLGLPVSTRWGATKWNGVKDRRPRLGLEHEGHCQCRECASFDAAERHDHVERESAHSADTSAGDYDGVVPSPGSLPKETAVPDEIAAWLETEERSWIPPCKMLTRDAHEAIGLRKVDPKPVRFIRDTRKDPVIEKRDSPLFHGSEYSSDSAGDGPSLEATTFFEAWPFISNWIKQNRRAHNLQLAEAWGRESDEHLLIKAFARLYNWRWREDTVGRPEQDAESAENQYRGWEDWLQDVGRYVDPWNEWLEANDTDSDGDDSGLSSMDAELDRDHPN